MSSRRSSAMSATPSIELFARSANCATSSVCAHQTIVLYIKCYYTRLERNPFTPTMIRHTADFITMAVSHYIAERSPTDYPFLCKTQGFNLEPMQDVFYWEILHQAHRGAPYLVGWPNGKETIQCISTSPSTFNPQRVVLPNDDDIEIGYRYNGRPLKTWLNSAYFARMSPGIATLANQQVWWELNGQSFRLMDLPPELRICIYEQVFATYTWKHAPDNAPVPSVLVSSGPTGPSYTPAAKYTAR
jgi:hypothetical protein